MKIKYTIPVLFAICSFGFVGCATLQSDITSIEANIQKDAPIVLKDIAGFWTALNAVNSVVGQTLNSTQLTSVLSAFGVSSSTSATVIKDLGIGENAVAITAQTSVALSNAISGVVSPANTAVSGPTTP